MELITHTDFCGSEPKPMRKSELLDHQFFLDLTDHHTVCRMPLAR